MLTTQNLLRVLYTSIFLRNNGSKCLMFTWNGEGNGRNTLSLLLVESLVFDDTEGMGIAEDYVWCWALVLTVLNLLVLLS